MPKFTLTKQQLQTLDYALDLATRYLEDLESDQQVQDLVYIKRFGKMKETLLNTNL